MQPPQGSAGLFPDCENFLPGVAWLVFSKTAMPFSRSVYVLGTEILLERFGQSRTSIICGFSRPYS